MALVLKDRVKQQTTTTGQGTITLSGSYTGFQSFEEIGDGNVTYYTIYDQTTGDWEVGYGTYTSLGTTLSRTGVYDSSAGGSKVDFQAGTKVVFCTQPAEQAIYQEVNGNLKLVGGVIGLTQDGTEGTTLPNTSFQAFTTGNYYMQANQQNLSSGAEASSDYICTADNGSDTNNYIDVGMASSGYNFPDYSAQKPNSGYVMSTGSDLRLIAGKYGAATPGGQDIVLIAGSTLDTEERIRVYGDTGNVNIGGGVNATDLGQRLQVAGSASISGAATFGSTVTLNADPSTALQAATKQYVDNAASTGIHIHDPCVSETSSALSAVYTQGGTTFDITDITGNKTLTTSVNHGLSVGDEIWLYSTAGNGLLTNTAYFVYSTPALNQLTISLTFGGAEITGLTNASGLAYNTRANSGVGAYLESSANQALPISGVSVSDRVLVYQQSTGYWNGVYTVTALGADDPGGSKWKLTRATDANKYEPSNTQGLGAGDYFFIESNSEAYVLTDPTGPVIIGYDTITYTLFSSVPAYTVNSPLSLVGTTLSLNTVPANLGGTSFSSYTAGDMIYATGSTSLAKLGVGASGETIISAGGVPAWGSLNMAGSGVSGVLPETHGGTNQSSYAVGDLLYSSATNTLSKLSGNTSTTKKYLNQTGTGSASAAPSWDVIDASDIATGTLAVARGGTGMSSYSVGDIVYASGTGTLSGLADAATGNVLLSGGINTAPSYGKVGLTTHVTGVLGVPNGGTGLSAISALSIPVANTADTYSTVTPSAGQSVRVNAGGTAWEAYTPSSGTVTSVTGTSPVVSSGGSTPAISLDTAYGDTQNPYASKTQNYVLASPNGSSGAPSFRALVAADVPTLNQDTTGSAGSLKSTTTTGLMTVTGMGAGTTRLKTVRDAADTLLELGGSYTPTATWNWTSATVTWPTFNQNTTGSAAKWTTARDLAGNSVDGSANVAFSNKFIVQGTADAGLSGAQFLGSLGTGLVKNTTSTGVLSIATAGTDYAPATSGTSILYGDGSGGFSNVTIGSGVDFSGGTLSATGSGGTVTSVSVASANGFAGTSSGGATPSLTLSTSITGMLKGNGTAISAGTANTDYLIPALANTAVTGFKTATFNSQTTIATTSGSITVDWTSAQNQKQTEPTGTITYTFTAPPGPCHLQLIIDSDGTSTAQTINWPGTVVWMGSTWAGTNNKKAVINFWYDGSNYIAVGTNQA